MRAFFAKHSLQYTGRSDLGSNGTRASPPQAAQVAVKYSRGPRAAFLRASTAGLAALGLVLEAALCVELLLAGGEYEFLAAFLAY